MSVEILEIEKILLSNRNSGYKNDISLETSGLSTSMLYVWERVQNWRKQREWKSMWEQETERHDKLDKFLYSAKPKSKHTSVVFRHSIKFF